IWSAQFSPDGKRTVTASWDRTARLWDARTGTPLAILKHAYKVHSAEFSEDGRNAITTDLYDTVQLWDLESPALSAIVLTGYSDRLKSSIVGVDLNPEGVLVVSSSGNHNPIVRIWRAFPGTQAFVDHSKTLLPRCLDAHERKKFYLDPKPLFWCI